MNQSIINKIGDFNKIEDIQNKLKIKRATAIKYMHLLRKKGLVKTEYGRNRKRFYRIIKVKSPIVGNDSFYHLINKYSPMKIVLRYDYRIFGRKATVEEAIVRAIAERNLKVILASLALFNHVKNWSRLYKYAKEYDVRRKIGALYDVSRTKLKVRRMDERIRNKLLKSKDKSRYIIKPFKSKDFLEIQKRWNVCVPLNKADLEVYDEW